MKNPFSLIVMAFALGIGLVPGARATTIYSTLGTDGTFDTNHFVRIGPTALVPGTPGAYADEFTSPVTATVGSVSLALAMPTAIPGVASPDVSGFNISVRANTPTGPGGPTNIVGTFGPGNVTQPGIYTFAATTDIQLVAGTEYWLSVGAGGSGEEAFWYLNDEGIDNVTASRSGGTWTVNGSGTALAFELNTVPEPGSAALCTMTVAAAYLWRKRTVPTRS